jgi:hypothetical protein
MLGNQEQQFYADFDACGDKGNATRSSKEDTALKEQNRNESPVARASSSGEKNVVSAHTLNLG